MPSPSPHHVHPWEFSRSEDFVSNKMETNDRRGRTGRAISKMAAHCTPHHLAQLVRGITLRRNCVTERSGDVNTIRFVVPDFEDNLAHWKNLLLP